MSRPMLAQPPAGQDSALSLRDALRALPTAEPSSDFDERVLSALRVPCPWWMTLWVGMRPVLASAACSLSVTLALIAWSTKAPVGLQPILLGALHPATVASVPTFQGDIDRLGNRPPTRANLMAALMNAPNAAAAPLPLPSSPRKTPELPRLRRQSCAPSLLA